MFSSDGKGDFLSLSHLHFGHQGNLHFYGIINEEESHLHFSCSPALQCLEEGESGRGTSAKD